MSRCGCPCSGGGKSEKETALYVSNAIAVLRTDRDVAACSRLVRLGQRIPEMVNECMLTICALGRSFECAQYCPLARIEIILR